MFISNVNSIHSTFKNRQVSQTSPYERKITQVPTIPPRTRQSCIPRPNTPGNAPSNAKLAQQIDALTAVVTNLTNAIACNQAPPAAVAAPPVAAISFATSPGEAAVEELIDYTTKHGASLYKQGRKALGIPFSMKAEFGRDY